MTVRGLHPDRGRLDLDHVVGSRPWGPAGTERRRLAVALHGPAADACLMADVALLGLATGCTVVWAGELRWWDTDVAQVEALARQALPTADLGLPPLQATTQSRPAPATADDDLLALDPVVRRFLGEVRNDVQHDSVDGLLAAPLAPGRPPLVLDLLWQHRPDLQDAFPRPHESDHDALLDWARTQGATEAGLSPQWLGVTAATLTEAPKRRRGWRRHVRRAVVVRVADAHKGMGVAADLLVRQLRAAGVDVREVPVDVTRSAVLDLRGHPVVVFAVNGDHLERVRRRTLTDPGTRHIGYWWWETTVIPAGYLRAAQWLDEVWAPTAFVHSVLDEALACPVRLVPSPLPPMRPVRARDSKPFTFLVEADADSSLWRKNPQGAVEAFCAAVPVPDPTRVRLVVKLRRASTSWLSEQGIERPDVELLCEELDRAGQDELTAASDAVLSLHRSEGFGLVLAEGLAAGKLVIATGWGGSEVLAGHDGFWRVACDVGPQDDPSGTYPPGGTWAEPDLRDAARLIARALERRQDAPEWALAGQGHLRSLQEAASSFRYRA